MLATFGFLAPTELVIVLIIALIIFGPGKLPELGKSLGKGINEFKSASQEPIKIVETIVNPKDMVNEKIGDGETLAK